VFGLRVSKLWCADEQAEDTEAVLGCYTYVLRCRTCVCVCVCACSLSSRHSFVEGVQYRTLLCVWEVVTVLQLKRKEGGECKDGGVCLELQSLSSCIAEGSDGEEC
jgi:hypothetical protein